MTTPEVETKIEKLAIQPEPLVEAGQPELTLVHGGLAKAISVAEKPKGPGLAQMAEELKDSEPAQKNLAFLHQRGTDFVFPDISSVQISLDRRQEALACGLLYSFEIMRLQHFPGKAHATRPDIYKAIDLFLHAKGVEGKEAFKLSDGKLAVGYDYPGSAVIIENINGSEHDGLNGAPKELLEAVLRSFDIEARTAEIEQSLVFEQASRNNSHPVTVAQFMNNTTTMKVQKD